MKKTLILASFLALAPFAKGQLLLEALEGGFTPSEKCLERVYDKHYGDGVPLLSLAKQTACPYRDRLSVLIPTESLSL